MAKTVVGVDISSSGIRAVEVRDAAKAKPTVVKYHSAVLPEGAVSRGEVLEPRTVAATLKQLWSTAGFTSKEVILGVGNHRVLARDFSVPRMSLGRIRESLPFQVQDMLPVPVEDALLDFYPVSESLGEAGPMVQGLLVAAVKESVVANVSAVELAGLHPIEVDLIPFALGRLLLRGAEGKGTVAIVDIGAHTSTVVIATDGVPQFVRIIPAGGGDLTDRLTSELGFTAEQADSAKRGLGIGSGAVSPEHRPIVDVILEVTGELIDSVRNTLNYFTASRPQSTLRQIILTGGGAKLGGFAAALQENTRVVVATGAPFTTVALDSKAQVAARASGDSVSVALGLALGGAR